MLARGGFSATNIREKLTAAILSYREIDGHHIHWLCYFLNATLLHQIEYSQTGMMDDSNTQHDTQNDTQDDDGCTPETNNSSSKTAKEKYETCWRIVCDIPLDDVEIIPLTMIQAMVKAFKSRK